MSASIRIHPGRMLSKYGQTHWDMCICVDGDYLGDNAHELEIFYRGDIADPENFLIPLHDILIVLTSHHCVHWFCPAVSLTATKILRWDQCNFGIMKSGIVFYKHKSVEARHCWWLALFSGGCVMKTGKFSTADKRH